MKYLLNIVITPMKFQWLVDLSSLKSLQSLSLVGDSFFDSHDEKMALDKLRAICPTLSSVFIHENSTQRIAQLQLLSHASTNSLAHQTLNSLTRNSDLNSRAVLADHWVYAPLTGEWACVGQVDLRDLALSDHPWR